MSENEKLIILTEKKSVAENYAKALSLKETKSGLYENTEKTLKITYAAGHLYEAFDARDYDEKYTSWISDTLPIIPTKFFYKAINESNKNRVRKNIIDIIKNNQDYGIVIATDPDREGEVIARLILDKIKVPEEKRTRVWMCEGLSRETIIKGLKERKKDFYYDELAEQGFTQKECDWVFGINVSRMVSILKREKYPVGRVQTALLKEIYRNNLSRMLFISKPYYTVKALTKTGTVFNLLNSETYKTEFSTKAEALKIAEEIKGKKYRVTLRKDNKKVIHAPQLYSLADLEIDSHKYFNVAPSKTLEAAQSLYNEKGVSSYPRTDCNYLSEADYDMTLGIYEQLILIDHRFNNLDKSNLKKDDARIFDSSKLTGHHAIIPTKYYSKDSESGNIYDLLERRFLMQFAPDYEYLEQKAEIRIGDITLKADGKKELVRGWKDVELRIRDEEEKNEINESLFSEGEIKSCEVIERHTEPEKLYTMASLLSFMKNPLKQKGKVDVTLGTAATQAETIRKLLSDGYIAEVNKSIRITKKGIALCELISEHKILDESTGVEVTDKWDKEIKKNPEALRKNVNETVIKINEELKKEMKVAEEKKVAGVCPACGRNIVCGKKGFYCEGYKDGCTNSILYNVYGNKYDISVIQKLLSEKKLDKTDGINKEGKKISYMIHVDESGHFIFTYFDEQEVLCKCPKCGNDVSEFKKTYRCRNKECDFFIWKETSGITVKPDMISKLCNGEKVHASKKLKDGGSSEIELYMNDDKTELKFNFINK